MKKLFALAITATLLIACGDDNPSEPDTELSSSEEVNLSSSSKEHGSSSEGQEKRNSSSSNQEVNSSSDTNISSSSIGSSESKAELSSSSNATESSSSINTEIPSVSGDDKLVLKEIPTFGELDGKPYFYTTQSRCTYKNGIFSITPYTSEYAYFYNISNDTLTFNYVKSEKVLLGTYEDSKLKETLLGPNKSIEGQWEKLCYFNLNSDYSNCEQSYSFIISKDTIYIVYTVSHDADYEIFRLIEKITHSQLGIFDEMSQAERSAKYAEKGISIDSSSSKKLIQINNTNTLSIDELTFKVKNNETNSLKLVISNSTKECTLTQEYTPIKSSKYCSEEYLPYLQIDDFDGYVSSYGISNEEEFDTCLESLLN